ncbi:putative membrane protein [Propionispora sp. 2/2-37]|uniref:DUF554 domain-containing protein n=1 Tax=Propionispora sp. 2/2-37 TaxID=1677858 RepID=UPI0006BB77A4|nr:DUF554 domain-containing protein [Propionispora sp. 2/2-37]CUH95782.1 putative membrane protein [Propionispora sp. 2/2-37]
MKGTLVNVSTVLVGALSGVLLKKGLPEKYQKTLTHGLGLAVGLIGLQMALKTNSILIVIISLVIGGILGEAIDIDRWLSALGSWINSRIGSQYGNAGQGFVTASLVFCVGAMAVVGSIQDGLTGDASTLYAKSILDGVFSFVFSSSMGIGVALSGISIFVYQGTITMLAGLFSSILSDNIIREMTAVGGVLIVGISLLMLEIKNIKVANFLPAIPAAALIAALWR